MITKEYMEGRAVGLRLGPFSNRNQYKPGTVRFEDWESGFRQGCKDKEWL